MNPSLLFLGLSAPACVLVARELMKRDCCDPQHPLLVVVPTKDAVRMLREQLAVCSAADGCDGAIICPRIMSVSQLGGLPEEHAAIASLQHAALFKVLKSGGVKRFRRLLPGTSGWKSSDWLARASLLLNLYETLLREGVDPAGTSREFQALVAEEPLWQEISELYCCYLAELHACGLQAPEETAALPQLPGMRVILACVPSLPEQSRRQLERAGVPVEVWLHADKKQHSFPAWFDAWGRPSAKWLEVPATGLPGLSTQGWEEHYLICSDVERMAEETARAAARQGGEAVCVAVCDSSMEPAVAEAFARHGVPTVRPRGIPFTSSGWHRLLLALIHLAEHLEERELTFSQQPHLPAEAVAALLHEPILTDGLGLSGLSQFVGELDKLMVEHLPSSWAAMRHYASSSLAQVLDCLGGWLNGLDSPRTLLEALRGLAARQLVAGGGLEESARLASNFTEQVDTQCRVLLEAPWLHELTSLDALQLLISAMHPAPAAHPEGALSLRGWLELSYAAEPCMVLAGLHDGIIPERWATHPYLTPRVRRALGIESDENKAARDACLLYSLCSCRPGRVDAVFSLLSTRRDPLFPSSLFFRLTPTEMMPALVEHFFGARRRCLTSEPATYSRKGWDYPRLALPPHVQSAADLAALSLAELNLSNPMAGKSCSPSSLRAFFECPLRFWLTKLAGLTDESVSPEQRDIESKNIGSRLHSALEHFVKRYPGLAAFRNAVPEASGAERESLVKCVEGELFRMYEEQGTSLEAELLPRRLQHEAIRHRLTAYAALHVSLWEDGWECACDAEGVPMVEYRVLWELDGHALDFRIDRIDTRLRPDGTREYRVIDYKSGEVKSCYDKHLTVCPPSDADKDLRLPGASLPVVTRADARGRIQEYRWADLQLPLYTAWAVEHFQGGEVSSAYMTISKKAGQTRVLTWDDDRCPFFSPEGGRREAAGDVNCLYGNALAWIRFGLQNIAEGRCLVSAEMMGWEPPRFSLFNDLLNGESMERLFLRFTQN